MKKVIKNRIDDCILYHHNNKMYDDKKVKFDTKVTVVERDVRSHRVIRMFTGGKNATILPGRIFLQENIFGMKPNPDHHVTLNDMLNVSHSTDVFNDDTGLYKQRQIDYFCIGNGAEDTVSAGRKVDPRNSDVKLFNQVPFRCVPINQDLSVSDQENYRLKVKETINGKDYYCYYAKKLIKDVVKVTYNDADYLPNPDHTQNLPDNDPSKPLGSGEVKVYTTYNLSIGAEEFKEWYLALKGTLEGASLSEIGLISGIDSINRTIGSPSENKNEIAGAEVFSKVTNTPIPMDDVSIERQIIYTLTSV